MTMLTTQPPLLRYKLKFYGNISHCILVIKCLVKYVQIKINIFIGKDYFLLMLEFKVVTFAINLRTRKERTTLYVDLMLYAIPPITWIRYKGISQTSKLIEEFNSLST